VDETELRSLLAGAFEPEPPLISPARRALQAGRRLRRRRRAAAAAASATAAAAIVLAAGLPAVTGVLGGPPATAPAAVRPTAYVATSAGTVVPISLSSNQAGLPISPKFPGSIAGMAITPDGRTLYVASVRGVVTPVSTATNRAGRPIRVSGAITDIAIASGGRTALVIEYGGIVPVNLRTRAAGPLIRIHDLQQVTIAPGGRTAYCTTFGAATADDEVYPVALGIGTGHVLKPIRLGVLRGGWPGAVAITDGGRAGYVVLERSERSPAPPEIVPLDLVTGKAGRPISLPAYSRTSLTIAPDGRTAYVLTHNLFPVDLTSGTVLPPIVLPDPLSNYDVYFAPDGRTAYAVPDTSNQVITVNLTTGALARQISWSPAYKQTQGMDFAPDGTAYVSVAAQVPGSPDWRGAEVPVSASGRVGRAISVGGFPQQVVFTPAPAGH
jgi:hypothetical protein